MDRPRFQVTIGRLMIVVAFTAIMFATWPYSVPFIELAIIWGVYRAASARMQGRWRGEGR